MQDFIYPLCNLLVVVATVWTAAAADLCSAIVTFAEGKSPRRQIFVSASGQLTGADGSESKPYGSLSAAIKEVKPGDAIRLLPGTYPPENQIANISGTATEPVWFGGIPGRPRPLIQGGTGALHLSRVRYLIIENLEVANASHNGINCDDAAAYADSNATRHVIFRNLFIHDIGTGRNNDGLKLSGVNDFYVLESEFFRMSAGGSGIDHVGCHRGLIAKCSFTDIGSNAVQCKGGSEDIEIRWNRFASNGGRAINIGGSTGFQYFRPPLSRTEPNFESKNIRVLANVFQGSDVPVAFVGTVHSVVANNTIIEPGRWIIRILQETLSRDGYQFLPSSHNDFFNNLVWFSSEVVNVPVSIGSNTDAASFRFANNLWYAFDRPTRSKPSLPSPEINSRVGEPPKFRDETKGDFRPAAGSPAAGNGRPNSFLRGDISNCCFRDPPSIGAFETIQE
jgi:hypothetical protein